MNSAYPTTAVETGQTETWRQSAWGELSTRRAPVTLNSAPGAAVFVESFQEQLVFLIRPPLSLFGDSVWLTYLEKTPSLQAVPCAVAKRNREGQECSAPSSRG